MSTQLDSSSSPGSSRPIYGISARSFFRSCSRAVLRSLKTFR